MIAYAVFDVYSDDTGFDDEANGSCQFFGRASEAGFDVGGDGTVYAFCDAANLIEEGAATDAFAVNVSKI